MSQYQSPHRLGEPRCYASADHHSTLNLGLSDLFLAIVVLAMALCTEPASAQTYPANFSQVLVANGISNPTVMAFAPDGRLFVAQQTGQLRLVKNGALLATPFVSLTVNSSGEWGLLGIAFDPVFATNNFIYLDYTVSSGATPFRSKCCSFENGCFSHRLYS